VGIRISNETHRPTFRKSRFLSPQPPTPSPMSPTERLNSDFLGTRVTIGKHPLAFHRQRLNALSVTTLQQTKICPYWTPGSNRRLRYLPPASRNCQGPAIPESGRRNRRLERGCHARRIRPRARHYSQHSYLFIEGEMQTLTTSFPSCEGTASSATCKGSKREALMEMTLSMFCISPSMKR